MEPSTAMNTALAGMAFLLSLVATVMSQQGARRAEQARVRSELTDILDELMSTAKEGLDFMPGEPGTPLMSQKDSLKGRLLSHRNVFLLSQAKFLVPRLKPGMVSPVEYHTLATACAHAGDHQESERFYLQALGRGGPRDFHRPNVLAGYANLLFWTQRPDDGRRRMQEAIDLVPQAQPVDRLRRMNFLVNWSLLEFQVANDPARGMAVGERAQAEMAHVPIPVVQQQFRSTLAHAEPASGPMSAPPFAPGPANARGEGLPADARSAGGQEASAARMQSISQMMEALRRDRVHAIPAKDPAVPGPPTRRRGKGGSPSSAS